MQTMLDPAHKRGLLLGTHAGKEASDKPRTSSSKRAKGLGDGSATIEENTNAEEANSKDRETRIKGCEIDRP